MREVKQQLKSASEKIYEIFEDEVDGLDLDSVLPPSGTFLRHYHDYAKTLTDAPSHYHLFCGLGILAAAVGNNVYIPSGVDNIYPNLWIILLAPSSVYRKTTCINWARQILFEADKGKILPHEVSPEALVSVLSNRSQGIFFWPEFGTTLANFQKDYSAGLKEFLTDIYDCGDEYVRKLKSMEYIIRRPCVSILAASAMDWFVGKCKEDDVRSGFLARFMYVPAFKKSRRITIQPPVDLKIKADCVFRTTLTTHSGRL